MNFKAIGGGEEEEEEDGDEVTFRVAKLQVAKAGTLSHALILSAASSNPVMCPVVWMTELMRMRDVLIQPVERAAADCEHCGLRAEENLSEDACRDGSGCDSSLVARQLCFCFIGLGCQNGRCVAARSLVACINFSHAL